MSLQQKQANIWVTFQKVGYHRYPDAPTEPFDVSYLRYEHRHLFKFKVTIEVTHNDREIEFHQFLHWLESLYEGDLKVDHKSCEMISDDLYAKITEKFPRRAVTIEVSEDGECGSIIHYQNSSYSANRIEASSGVCESL